MMWNNVLELVRWRDQDRKEFIQGAEACKDHIEKIKKHYSTKVLGYKNYKNAYDYVDKLFPKAEVKNVVIYRCNIDYLKRLGYKSVGGFYNRIMQAVVIPSTFNFGDKKGKLWDSIKAKLTDDEVVVHELLHYASDMHSRGITSAEIEEEFAYGHSVKYLRSKGHSDEYIVKNNFLPFLISTIDPHRSIREVMVANGYEPSEWKHKSSDAVQKLMKKLEKQIFENIQAKAIKKGLEIVEMYTRDEKPVNAKDIKMDDFGKSRFSKMDF
jgi:hypothetical protein